MLLLKYDGFILKLTLYSIFAEGTNVYIDKTFLNGIDAYVVIAGVTNC